MGTTLAPDDVLIGTAAGPGIWMAPLGTPPPADALAALPAEWSTLGYLSEDGVTFGSSTDSESITPWQSRTPVRSVITGRELSAEFTMIEFTAQNLALYFGQAPAVETDGSFAMEVRSDAPARMQALLIDVADGDVRVRYFFPRSSLSESGDLEVTSGGAMGLPVTLTALDDAGVLARVFKDTVVTLPVAAKAKGE